MATAKKAAPPPAKAAPAAKAAPKRAVDPKVADAHEAKMIADVEAQAKKAGAKAPAKKGIVAQAKAEAKVEKAEPVKSDREANLTDVAEELEADQPEYRKVQRPVWDKVKAFAWAVLMGVWIPEGYGEEPENIADRDFQGYASEADATAFFRIQCKWAADDVDEFGNLRHAIVLLRTDPLKIYNTQVFGGDQAWRKHIKDAITADHKVMLTEKRRNTAPAPAQPAPAKKAGAKKAPLAKRVPQEAAKEVLAAAKAKKAPIARKTVEAPAPVVGAAKAKVKEFLAEKGKKQADPKAQELANAFVGSKARK